MSPSDGKNRWSTLLEYGLAVAAVALATWFRLLLQPQMGLTVPYVTYFLANALVIRFTGLGPSVVAIVLSTLAADYFFLPPQYTFASSPAQYLTSAMFVLANIVILALARAMRKSKDRAECQAKGLEKAKEDLEWQILECKKTEEALKESEYRYAMAQRAANIGSWDWNIETGELHWSEQIEPMFGFAAGKFRGTFQSFIECIHPEDRDIVSKAVDAAVKEGRNYRVEHRIVWPDGSVHWVSEAGEVHRKPDGTAFRMFGIVRDITGRKEAQEAVRRSEERLRATFDNAGVGIVEVDASDRFIAVNEQVCIILGYGREELLGMTVHELTFPEDRQMSDQLNTELRSGVRKSLNYEKRFLKRDGTSLWVHVTVAPVRDKTGRWLRWIGTVEDISERKRAEEGLRQAREQLRQHAGNLEKIVEERTARLQELVGELEQFSYTLSHDMRAPLRAMGGFAEMLMEPDFGISGNETSRGLLQRIISGANRMDLLISDALEYMRSVHSTMQLVPVDVGALLKEMVQTQPHLQPLFADVSLEGELPRVLGNATALTQSFSNLLSNAVKYVAEDVKPRIRIYPEDRGEMVRIWVEDNGIGIAAEHQADIFKMFYRVSNTYAGTGIGLALVGKNIERMGGKVGLESELGKGSRFWVELRRSEE